MASVIVFGRYEELPDTPEWRRELEVAYNQLRERAMWWQPAYAAMWHRSPHSFIPVFYRIGVDEITGHRGMPDPTESIGQVLPSSDSNWLSNLLRRARVKIKSHRS